MMKEFIDSLLSVLLILVAGIIRTACSVAFSDSGTGPEGASFAFAFASFSLPSFPSLPSLSFSLPSFSLPSFSFSLPSLSFPLSLPFPLPPLPPCQRQHCTQHCT